MALNKYDLESFLWLNPFLISKTSSVLMLMQVSVSSMMVVGVRLKCNKGLRLI